MIEVDSVSAWYGSFQALDGVTFTAGSGVTGLLGRNGAGKSTLLRTISGVVPLVEGSVRLCGVSVSHDPTAAKRVVGYLPEGAPLYGELTAGEQLRIVGSLRGVPRERLNAMVREVAERCGVGGHLSVLSRHLSQGFRRRVAMALALIGDPPIVLLDEPTATLDPHQASEARELIRSIARERTVILSTHLLGEVSRLCTNLIILEDGRLVSSGSLEKLRSS